MMKMLGSIVCALGLMVLAFPVVAQTEAIVPEAIAPPPEVRLGREPARLNESSVKVRVGPRAGKFQHVTINVRGGVLDIMTAKISYTEGEAQEMLPKAGQTPEPTESDASETRDRRGRRVRKASAPLGKAKIVFRADPARLVSEVEILYRANPKAKEQVQVEVYGAYVDGWLGATGEGRTRNDGWVLLATDFASFGGLDWQTFSIAGYGPLRAIRVTARDRAIALREFSLVYGDGQRDTRALQERIEPNESFGPFEVNLARPMPTKVEARFRARHADGNATAEASETTMVEIWGLP